MKTLFFFGHNNIGDGLITSIIMQSLRHSIPECKIHIVFKNSFSMKEIFPQKEFEISTICTKISLKFVTSHFKLYCKIIKALKGGDIIISGLLGSSTISKTLTPLLLWSKLFCKNKIEILHLKPLFDAIPINKHLVNFHIEKFQNHFNCKIPIKMPQICKVFPQKNTIALCIGASRPWKSLPIEKLSTIANYLTKSGFKVKILGGKNDIPNAEIIISNNKNLNQIENLTGKTTVLEFIKHCGDAEIVIGNDSSPQHICEVLSTPCITIWGRNPNSQTVHAYCWNNPLHLNIFNKPYIFEDKQDQIGRNKHLISLNLQAISTEMIINEIEKFIREIKS